MTRVELALERMRALGYDPTRRWVGWGQGWAVDVDGETLYGEGLAEIDAVATRWLERREAQWRAGPDGPSGVRRTG